MMSHHSLILNVVILFHSFRITQNYYKNQAENKVNILSPKKTEYYDDKMTLVRNRITDLFNLNIRNSNFMK